MGRSLFSQNYSTPTSLQPLPTTWSKFNSFDPDSDDFFIDAVYEAFLDPSEYQHQQQNATLTVVLPDDDEENLDDRTPVIMQIDSDRDSGVSLSSASPLSSRESPSPMAVGADDPAVILADAGYTDVTLRPEWRRARASMATTYESWLRMGRPVSSVLPTEAASPPPSTGYIPPLSIDDDDDDNDIGPLSIHPDLNPHLNYNPLRSSSLIAAQDRQPLTRSNPIPISRRTVSITPIDVTPLDRRPSPAPRSPPANMAILQTPPRSRDTSQMSPSPVSTVIPRIYTWNSTATAPRPSISPLTNPSARISHSRINIAPVHVRMQSAAVSP